MVYLAAEHAFEFTTMEAIMVAGLMLTVLGGMMATGRAHINRRVDTKLEAEVKDAVTQSLAPYDVKLDAILLNLRETSVAVGRVHDLEVVIKNGLSSKVDSIESDVADIRKHLLLDGTTERRD